MSVAILWFKNDLRLHDNESLVKAVASGKLLIPIYCVDPQHYRKLKYGFPKCDLVRFEFLKQSILDLKENLRNIGANLMILHGPTDVEISKIVERYQCDDIYADQEFATEEMETIERLKTKISETCTLNLTWGRTLYHLDDIPYAIEDIPLTSKAFRVNTQKKANIRKTFAAPTGIQTLPIADTEWGEFPSAGELGLPSKKNFALTFMEGGETKALERMKYYLFETEQLTSYRWTRNRSLGLDYSSKFSPYMALGCLSPRTIYEAVKDYEQNVKKNQSTWWLIFEIVWRDYFTFKLMRFQNKVYHNEGYTDKRQEFTNDIELFERWCKGLTGIPFIDAHMRQLNETGFMSNRGRVNCSSFLVYDYKVDWTWGAAYFESKLIDYDVASNWMNWHTQAYQIWYTNPVNQANKYKAQGFIRKWIPEISQLSDRDILIPWESALKNYPKPKEIFAKWSRAIHKIKKDYPQ
ncbi:DASH family cryptochrome [Pareuzebyella sediminis]|uniref:DASH family cryptochrome n=1 Tax=Pareuzebyella sediminis TaxID=2607998 RepID=UPI0011EE9F9F|nr:DASH family cryptochrome [Pareuzebyella sediminis]